MTIGNKIRITIDGKAITAEHDRPILYYARDMGIDIPTLCHDDRLTTYTSCFLCVVEIENISDLVPSCTRCPEDGMVIHTSNEKIKNARKMALELLASDHYANCIAPCLIINKSVKRGKWLSRRTDFIPTSGNASLCVREVEAKQFENMEISLYQPESPDCKICQCNKISTCELRKLAVKYNIEPGKHFGEFHNYKIQKLTPHLILDMNKCIRCAKCIRICEEIQQTGILAFIYRGFDTELYYAAHTKEKEEECFNCIASDAKCVNVCPTGALYCLETKPEPSEK